MSRTPDARSGFASLALLAGLVLAVHAAPGPSFDAFPLWAGAVKVSHGYLAYAGVNAGITAGALVVQSR